MMTNKELIDFNFVDRTEEKNKIDEFISKDQIKTLIILGEKDVGKNYLIDKIIESNKSKSFLMFDFKDLLCKNAYGTMLRKLDSYRNGDFLLFIKNNYKKILKASNFAITKYVEKTFQTLPSLIDSLIDIDSLLISNDSKSESSVKVLSKYISEIARAEDLIIVIKNFTDCDSYSLPLILNVLSTTIESKNEKIRYIISMDIDGFKNSYDIFHFFTSIISTLPIYLKPFEDPSLFYEMLMDIFDLTNDDYNSIDHVFNICNGYPGKLRDLLCHTYIENPIYFNNKKGKVKWDESIIKISNKNNVIMFNHDIYKKLVFLIVLFLKIDLDYNTLINVAKYISECLHFINSNGEIENAISQLIYLDNLLEQDISNNIHISSNINKDLYYSEYINDSILALISSKLYCYLINNKDIIMTKNTDAYMEQIAWHSYKSGMNGWIDQNVCSGKYFYERKHLSLAKEIFYRLINVKEDIATKDIIIISNCLYDAGSYKHAEAFIDYLPFEICNYKTNFLRVKIKSIIMKKEEAINVLNNMYIIPFYSDHKYEILDMKQRILSNIKGSRYEAKKIFDNILKDYNMGLTSYTPFMISAMEYARGKKVQKCFSILESEYEHNSIMLAELYVNKGFDLFWQGNIEDAENEFKKSITHFENIRLHELSYVLNNYANCLMMKGDIQNAIASLRRGLIFNRSPYTEITLKTNLLVCYMLINNNRTYELFDELEHYLIDNKDSELDISIYLKVMYALGFVQRTTPIQNDEIRKTLYSHCESYIDLAMNTANEYKADTLPYLWFDNWRDDIESDIKKRVDRNKYDYFYTYRFEPWLLTITHD